MQTAVAVFGDRYVPPAALQEQARAIQSSGVVDQLVVPDQLNNFVPPMLWTAENSPLAAVVPDIDSAADAFTTAAYLAAAVPGMELTLTTDSIRRGPAELIQTMMSLANITEGRVTFQIGGGEQKQCRPYGYRRGQGLARMEDLFEIFNRLWVAEGPIDYEGHHTTFKQASLGGARQHRPKLWGLGGGPRLVDLATSHCDGFAAAAPCTWATPDQAAVEIGRIKQLLRDKGHDPEGFGFGIFCPVLLHDDPARIEAALDNPMTRWMAATYGRIDPADWAAVGLSSPVPEGWTYYLKMVPQHETPEFVGEVLSATTRAHAEAGFLAGTPEQVAAELAAYCEAGVTWVMPLDYMVLMLEPEELPEALNRTLQVCAGLKSVGVRA
ncbi:MAG: LLM class flavin-dependent oxidoreductase [Solirubrobacteraceae bacterium]